MNHGAPSCFKVPNEFMTGDLIMMMWGGIDLWASGKIIYKEYVLKIARHVMSRQVPEHKKEGEFYGHFTPSTIVNLQKRQILITMLVTIQEQHCIVSLIMLSHSLLL